MKIKSLGNSVQKGIFSVAGASFINKVISFVSNILIVRFVSQSQYGLYSSAFNIISLVMLFTGAGTVSGVLQYASEKRTQAEKDSFSKFCLYFGLFFDVLLTLVVVLYAFFNLGPFKEANKYLYMLAPMILLHFLFEFLGSLVRSKKEASKYAVMMNVNSISNSILSCVGAYFWGINGLIIGRNLSYLLGCAVGIFYNLTLIININRAVKLIKKQVKDILKYSVSCCIIAALNRVLYVIDVTIISYIVKDSTQVAIYKVGTQIPEALEFLPFSIMVAVIPYFAEHNQDIKWLQKWTKKLYIYSGIFNLAISATLLIFSTQIIRLFWGESYTASIPIFNILSINYFIMATFRQTGTNILSALREVKYNLIISCISCVINIVLDIVCVHLYGIYGAALATLLVVIIASSLSLPYVHNLIYKQRRKRS